MKIVIIGAGDVGLYLCAFLSEKTYQVTLIESADETAQQVDTQYDVKVIRGNGSSAEMLYHSGVEKCDFFLAMTSDDKTNIISCSLAKRMGAKATIARIHDQTYRDNSFINYQFHFGIDYTINPEALCAVELAKAIRNPGRVAVETFARGAIEVQQVKVSAHSKLIGKQLKDLKLPSNIRIGYVQRHHIVEVASKETVLQTGDAVTLLGAADALFELKSKFDPENKTDLIRIVLFGGGETAIALARLLINPRFRVRIVERDEGICRQLAEKLPHVTVIHGETTSLRLMEEEQIGSCDYFIACTKKDEDNIMSGLQATQLGAKHVHLVLNRVDYEEVISKLKLLMGVELVVSPRLATAKEVIQNLSTDPFIELASLPQNSGKIIEIRVSPKSKYASQSLKEITLPPSCLIVALQHKFQVKLPSADDKILPHDRLVLITKDEKTTIERLLAIFADE